MVCQKATAGVGWRTSRFRPTARFSFLNVCERVQCHTAIAILTLIFRENRPPAGIRRTGERTTTTRRIVLRCPSRGPNRRVSRRSRPGRSRATRCSRAGRGHRASHRRPEGITVPRATTPEFYQTLTEAQLMDLWRTQQDKLATAEVWRRYQEKLIERGHRSRGGEFTEESVQISAFASVLRMGRERVFNTDRDDWLWRLLATISANKLATRHRKRREATGDLFDDLPVPMSLDPGPDEIAMYNEQRQRLMEVLTKREREYFECREEGMKQVDIAKYWQRDVKTVYRVGIAVQQKAARLFRGDIQGDGVVS